MRRSKYTVIYAAVALLLASCNTTKLVPDDDQLFIGLKEIKYKNYEKSAYAEETKAEVDAALATAPNGALFGSSYHRTLPYALWIYNAFSQSHGVFGKWMTKTFGKEPVLMSWVNPELRSLVAESVMKNHGYFHADVDYKNYTMKNPKKAKIGYTVDMGELFRLDSIEYRNFPAKADSLIRSSKEDAVIHRGDPFNVATLEAERARIATLFRNNGYYYYQSSYTSYSADSVQVPGKVQLRMEPVSNVPLEAQKQWYIGKISVKFRKTFMERPDSIRQFRHLSIAFKGKHQPIRSRVMLADLKLRPRQLFSYEKYLESLNKLTSTGIYSRVDFKFTPRDTTETCDTLDLALSCVFEKPYDFYIETRAKNSTIGRFGPELVIGLTKRNAFRGGEKLDINLHGNYEWQTRGDKSLKNSYEYGYDVSLEFPRIVAPFFGGNRIRRDSNGRIKRRRRYFFSAPTTIARLSNNVINRSGYFNMNTISAEWIYKWRTSAQSTNEFSPLTLQYQYLNSTTAEFDEIVKKQPYLAVSLANKFIPKMRYTYIYNSPSSYVNPIYWETTFTEAGNLISLGMMTMGKKWNDKDKKLYKTEYAQFVKVETNFTKTWTLNNNSQLVGHVNGGVIVPYANSSVAPHSEMFYVGGANSIRAFPIRGVGPGSVVFKNRDESFLAQVGEMKLVMNLEWRYRLFGSLFSAIFLDAGNVWDISNSDKAEEVGAKFKIKNLFKETALGTGVGIRYDFDFLVLRLDWGVGLHLPYDTGRSGYFNIGKFKDVQTLHLAIGYPF